jgi:hypothetical protein
MTAKHYLTKNKKDKRKKKQKNIIEKVQVQNKVIVDLIKKLWI